MSNNDIETIKGRIDIVEIIGEYVSLHKAGKNYKGISPFTNEKSPSFFVSPDRQLYHCFSSGKGGDIFTFIQEMEGVDFYGALKILAQRAGVTLSHSGVQSSEKYDVLYKIMEEATTFFETKLQENKDASTYIESRGITADTVAEWRVGYAPDEWRMLLEYLRTKGFSDADIKMSGLIKEAASKDGQERKEVRYYDTFRGRVMFPIFDISGRVVAFTGRILNPSTTSTSSGQAGSGQEVPKYVNSPETPLYNKSEIIYGLDKAKPFIRKLDYAILVEGQMDVVLCHQYGLKNAVASSGTALTNEQIKILKRYSSRLIVAYDSDRAGINAALKNAELGMRNGMDVKVARLPEGKDPADILQEDYTKLKEALKESMHVVDFYVDRILSEEQDARVVARRVKDEILKLILSVPSSIEKAHFIQRVSEKTNIPERAVREDFEELTKRGDEHSYDVTNVNPRETPLRQDPVKRTSRKDRVLRETFGLLYWQMSLNTKHIDVERFEMNVKDILEDEYKTTAELFKGLENQIMFEADVKYSEIGDIERESRSLIQSLESEIVKERFSKVMNSLAQAEKVGDTEKTERLLEKLKKLTEKHHNKT